MKKIFGLGLAALMLALPACVQDLTNDEGIAGGGTETLTFSVQMESPDVVNENGTRVTLDEDNATMIWEGGETLTFVVNNAGTVSNVTGTISADAAGKKITEAANVTVEIPEGAEICYVVKLSDQATISKERTSTKCRVSITQSSFLTGTDIATLVSKSPFVGVVAEDGTITLKNTMAYAKVQLQGSGTLRGVELMSRTVQFRSDHGFVSAADEEPTWRSYDRMIDADGVPHHGTGPWAYGGVASFNLNKTLSDESIAVYFAIPVAEFPARDMYISVRTANYSRLYCSSAAHLFKRNQVNTFKPITVSQLDYAGAIDISDPNGSNCYMVAPSTADKKYCFDMMRSGATPATSHDLSYALSVEPIWMTSEDLVTDLCMDYATNKIYFTVPGNNKQGSAIVGLVTQYTTSSKSPYFNRNWHIWVTDATSVNGMLDRNLGALWTPKNADEVAKMTGETAAQTCGIYYQYGAYLGLPAPKTMDGTRTNKYGLEGKPTSGTATRYYNLSEVAHYKFRRWGAHFSCYTAATNKSAQAMGNAYPMTQAYSLGDALDDTWCSNLTEYTLGGTTATWSATVKGTTDPCPQGYRIATHEELAAFFVTDKTYKHYLVNTKEVIEGAQKGDCQTFGGYFEVDGKFIWLPNAGYRIGTLAKKTNTSLHNDVGSLRTAGYKVYDGEVVSNQSAAILRGVPVNEFTLADESVVHSGSFGSGLKRYVPHVEKVMARALTTNLGFGLDAATPVRCVKMTEGVSVASIEGTTTDTNGWN